MSDLLEGMVLHNFEGKTPSGPETLALIETLRKSCKRDLTAADRHRIFEDRPGEPE